MCANQKCILPPKIGVAPSLCVEYYLLVILHPRKFNTLGKGSAGSRTQKELIHWVKGQQVQELYLTSAFLAITQNTLDAANISPFLMLSRLFVGGHSAGGHLSACMLYTDWSRYGLETQPFSGTILLSGLYDLVPIQRSIVNEPLHLTE